MDSKKQCRWCTKRFDPKVKQQRYCDEICAFKGKRRATFKAYLEGKEREISYPIRDIDNDLGLSFGKECYTE